MKVLLVEDNPGDVGLVTAYLAETQGLPATLEVAGSLSDGLKRLAKGGVDIVLLDLFLPDSQGLDTLDKVKAQAPAIPIIVLTGLADEEMGLRAIREGADDYVVKGPELTGKALSRILRYAAERKRAEQALRASEERFRLLYEKSPLAYQSLDADGRFLSVNEAWLSVLGYSREEVLGRWFGDFTTQPDLFRERFPLFKKAGEIHGVEFDLRRADGKVITVSYDGKTGYDSHGEFKQTHCIFQDVTERKRLKDGLRAAEEKYRTIVETANEGIWLLDEDMIISYVNPKMAQLLGYSPEEMVDKSPLTFADEEWKKPMIEYLGQRRKGIGGQHEGRLLRKDGTRFDSLVSATPLLDANGSYRGQVSIHTDITERKRAEEALRKWAHVFEHTAWGVIVSGEDPSTFGMVNPAFAAMHGYAVEELRGKPIADVVAAEHRAALPEEIRLVNEQGHYIYESKHLRKDGSVFPVLADVTAVKDDEGTVLYRCANVRDITERKVAEEELRRAVDQLEDTLQCTIEALSSTVEMKDQYTAGHQRRVTLLSCAIAGAMGLSGPQLDAIKKAGLVHDIGKMAIPNEVLSTPRRLSDIEMSLIRTHPQAGYDVLRTIPFRMPVAQIELQHHERLDGSGYPSGLHGDDILLEARILAVADVVEAMSSHRPYRPALGVLMALDEISKGAGVLYDPEVVEACVTLFQKKGFKFE